MSTLKYKRTTEIVERLKKLQGKHNYTDYEVAEQIGIKPTTYKNFIRSVQDEKNSYIKHSYIEKLADFYDCTIDYILCRSDDMDLTKEAHPKIKAFNFSERDTLILEVNHYLKSDYKTLQEIHFILCQMPTWRRSEYLRGFHAVTRALMEHSLLDRFKKSSGDDFDTFVEGTMKYDDDYYNHILTLHHANKALDIADFQISLNCYLEIIYDTLTKSLTYVPIAHKAAEKVLWLKKNWEEFPDELRLFTDALPSIQKYNFLIEKLKNNDLLDSKKQNNYKGIKLSEIIIPTLNRYLIQQK